MRLVLDVRPSGFVDAATALDDGVADGVRSGWLALHNTLDSVHAMAGSDPVGAAWGAAYDRMAAAASLATSDCSNACFQVAALLEQTGLNYANAENASRSGGPSAAARRRSRTRSVSVDSVPTAVGAGTSAPAGWGLVQHAIGRMWPNGHQDRLHAASDAWTKAATRLYWHLADLDRAIDWLTEQRTPDTPDAVLVLQGLRTRLLELTTEYFRIATACTDYAHHLDQAHHQIIGEIESFVKWTAGIEIFGGLFSVVSLGASEAAAQAGEAAEISRVGAAIRTIIDTLVAVSEAGGAAMGAVAERLGDITTAMRAILERQVEEARLVGVERGAISFEGKLPITAAEDSAVAMTSDEAAIVRLTDEATIGPASETWGDTRTLATHFRKHRKDFDFDSPEEYARGAAIFFRKAIRERMPMKVDKLKQTLRFYDRDTNTFASYRFDGRTRTFYKPSSREDYWDSQPGVLTND